MSTNERLRKHAVRLVDEYGVNQKVLAGRMGMSAGAFSKWLREKSTRAVSTAALDGLERYELDLAAELAQHREESRRESPAPEPAPAPSTAVDRFRQSSAKSVSRPHVARSGRGK